MTKFSKLAVVAALAVSAAGASATGLIDDFSVGQALASDTSTNGLAVWSPQVAGGMIGGFRDLFVQKTGAFGDDGFAGVSAFVNGGRLNYSQDSGQSGIGYVRWDGIATGGAINTSGLGGMNLISLMGPLGISVQVLSADLNFPFTFQVWTDPTNTNTWVMSQATTLAAAGPGAYQLLFSSFVGADFTRVGAVQMLLNDGIRNDIPRLTGNRLSRSRLQICILYSA